MDGFSGTNSAIVKQFINLIAMYETPHYGGEMKKRVLVVDDSEIVLEKVCEALVSGGYEVITALSAAAADTYIYGDSRPDIIILDVMMPMLDGDKKAKLLKADDLTRDIPVLLLSSKNETELAILAHEAGADGFIRKPFTFRELLEKIENTLQN
jgi:DNA-binding response OmpR family regulator